MGLFDNNGWLNSTDGAFNQPSTYVGLQYVPRNPDLPPLDGIREFLKENERIRKEHEAYQKAASPDDKKFQELMSKAEGLSGQVSGLANMYSQFKQDFQKKFQGDAVFSDEAKAALSRMTQLFGPAAMNELKQNRDLWTDQKKRVGDRKIGGDVWTDGSLVLVRDNKTGKVSEVSAQIAGTALQDPEKRKEFSLLTNDEAIDWKDKHWKLGTADSLSIGNQMSMAEVNGEINKLLTGVGHSSGENSSEQARNLAAYFKNMGIDAGKGNVWEQVSQKYKNNKAQLAEAQKRIYNSLGPDAQAALVANMLSKGMNPYGTTEVKTQEGTAKVSNLGLYMQEIVGSAVGSRSVNESGQSVGYSSLSSVLGKKGDDDNEFPMSFQQLIWNSPEAISGSEPVNWIDPKTGNRVGATAVPIKNKDIEAKFPRAGETYQVTQGEKFVIAGKEVRLGTSGNQGDPRKAVILKGVQQTIVVQEPVINRSTGQPQRDENGEVLTAPKTYMVKTALVPRSTLKSVNGEYEKKPFELGIISGAKGINGAEADLEDVDAKSAMLASGMTEEQADNMMSSFNWNEDVFSVRVYQEVNEFDVHSDGKDVNDRKIFSGNYDAYDQYNRQMEERMNQLQKTYTDLKK